MKNKFYQNAKKAILLGLNAIILSGCYHHPKSTETNDSKTVLVTATPDSFTQLKVVQQLLTKQFTNPEHKQQYLFDQNRLNATQLSELKYSLAFFDLFLKKEAINNNFEFLVTRQNAADFIHHTITKNWFWYLKNIHLMLFAYNPFYRDKKTVRTGRSNPKHDEQLFNDASTHNANLMRRLANNQIVDSFVFDVPWLTQDIYQTKQVSYLVYPDHWYMRMYWLQKADQTYDVMVWPDLYQLVGSADFNIDDPQTVKTFWSDFETRFFMQRMQFADDYFDYLQGWENDLDQSRLTQLQTQAYTRYNDTNFYANIFDGYFYDVNMQVINDINQTTLKVMRYSLKGNYVDAN